MTSISKTEEGGKNIETREHEDGRKDVVIQVHSLDVDLNEPGNAEAKQFIEEKVLPALAKKRITVTVIHKPTNDSFSFVCHLPEVREYAERVARSRGGEFSDYCVVQHDGETVSVTSL